jgi:hypothetical protein
MIRDNVIYLVGIVPKERMKFTTTKDNLYRVIVGGLRL